MSEEQQWEILFEKTDIDIKLVGCLGKFVFLLSWIGLVFSLFGILNYFVHYFQIFEFMNYVLDIHDMNFHLIILILSIIIFIFSLKSILKNIFKSKTNTNISSQTEYVEGVVTETHKTPSKNNPNTYGYSVTIDGKKVPVDVISFGKIKIHNTIRIEFQKTTRMLLSVSRKLSV